MPVDVRKTDSLDLEICPSLFLSYETEQGFCAGVLQINGQKIVFCLYPASDFTAKDEYYQSGDILICRGMIPPTLDANRFRDVIVLTDKSAASLDLPQNAISTADEGGYKLVIPHHKTPD